MNTSRSGELLTKESRSIVDRSINEYPNNLEPIWDIIILIILIIMIILIILIMIIVIIVIVINTISCIYGICFEYDINDWNQKRYGLRHRNCLRFVKLHEKNTIRSMTTIQAWPSGLGWHPFSDSLLGLFVVILWGIQWDLKKKGLYSDSMGYEWDTPSDNST